MKKVFCLLLVIASASAFAKGGGGGGSASHPKSFYQHLGEHHYVVSKSTARALGPKVAEPIVMTQPLATRKARS